MVMLTLPLPASLKDDMKALARADCVTLSEWVRANLRNTVRRSRAAKRKPALNAAR